MLYFVGNCQAKALREGYTETTSVASGYVNISTPLQFRMEHVDAVADERQWIEEAGLCELFPGEDYLPAPLFEGPEPTALVFTMAHENGPVFRHRDKGYLVYVPRPVSDSSPLYMARLLRLFTPVPMDPQSYFQRFRGMLVRARALYPDVPMLVLRRTSHAPGLGPAPRSYLTCWDDRWNDLSLESRLLRGLEGCAMARMDHFAVSVMEASGRGPESLFPFLRLALDEAGGFAARRDLEHADPVLARCVAGEMDGMLKRVGNGLNEADSAEKKPPEAPWSPRPVSLERIGEHLAANDRYRAAEGVAALLWQPEMAGKHGAPLLADHGACMPAFPLFLHMVKGYAALHPDPALGAWCRAHSERARADLAEDGFSSSFVQRYLDEVAALERSCVGRDSVG